MQQFKEKLYTCILATFLSTIATYFIFADDINNQIIWIVFLVYGFAISTYGICVSILANFISTKFKKGTVASLVRLFIYVIFGGTYFIFEFIGVYGLIAAISFFIGEEIVRVIGRKKSGSSFSKNNFFKE